MADQQQPKRGFVVVPGAGRPLLAAGGAVLASAAETDGLYSLIHSRAPAGDHVPRHVHHDVDEAFYVIEGEYSVECGDDSFDARAGAFVYLPRGVPHAYRVGASGGIKLILAVPGGLEEFFTDMDAGADLDEIAHRHGVSFLA